MAKTKPDKSTRWLIDRHKLLVAALDESVKLQSHYANLLNMTDGGNRLLFKSGSEWINRLTECGRIESKENRIQEPTVRCGTCGEELQDVRPGKSQCPNCCP